MDGASSAASLDGLVGRQGDSPPQQPADHGDGMEGGEAADAEGDCDGALTASLVRLRRGLLEDGRGPGRRLHSLHRLLFASTTALVCSVVLAAIYLWESFTSDTRDPLFLFFGVFSCASASAVFRTRGHLALDAVDEAIALCRALEASRREAAHVQARLAAVARRADRLLLAYRCFIGFSSFSLAYNMVAGGLLLAAPLTELFKMYAGVGSLLALYQLLPLHLVLYAVIAALFLAATAGVQGHGAAGSTVRYGVLCSRLQLLCRRVDRICGPLYPLVLLCSMVMPMVSMADGVRGGASLTGYAVMPLLFVILVPLCMGGQNVQDSSLAVSGGCYRGPWLTESPAQRRCRLMVMQMASVESSVHAHSLVRLNRATCLEALRKWFSFFQMLLNLKHH